MSLMTISICLTRLLYVLCYHPLVNTRTQGLVAAIGRFVLRPVHFVMVWNPLPPSLPSPYSSRVFSLIQDFDRHPVLSARLLQNMKPERLARAVLVYRGGVASTRAVSTLLSLVNDQEARRHIVRHIIGDPYVLRHVLLTEPASFSSDPDRDRLMRSLMVAAGSSHAASLAAISTIDANVAVWMLEAASYGEIKHPLRVHWPTVTTAGLDVFHWLASQASTGHTVGELVSRVEACIDTSQPGWDKLLQIALRKNRTFADAEVACIPLRARPDRITEIAELIAAGAPADFEALVDVTDAWARK